MCVCVCVCVCLCVCVIVCVCTAYMHTTTVACWFEIESNPALTHVNRDPRPAIILLEATVPLVQCVGPLRLPVAVSISQQTTMLCDNNASDNVFPPKADGIIAACRLSKQVCVKVNAVQIITDPEVLPIVINVRVTAVIIRVSIARPIRHVPNRTEDRPILVRSHAHLQVKRPVHFDQEYNVLARRNCRSTESVRDLLVEESHRGAGDRGLFVEQVCWVDIVVYVEHKVPVSVIREP